MKVNGMSNAIDGGSIDTGIMLSAMTKKEKLTLIANAIRSIEQFEELIEKQPEPKAIGYQIFDSMDIAQSGVEQREELLFPLLDTLAKEAEEDGQPVTFGIAKVFDDGGRTYDF